ncbi:MAG: hypothetical protein U0800_24075 [Isosphaeraceae bacterium]
MKSKWMFLVATVIGASLAISSANAWTAEKGDDSPLAKLMEKVNKSHNTVRNAVKTPVAYKKADPKKLIEETEAQIKWAKEARDFTEPAKTQKKTQKEWTDATDAWIKASEEFLGVLKAENGQAEAKKAHAPLVKSCTDCHAIFRVDGDDF